MKAGIARSGAGTFDGDRDVADNRGNSDGQAEHIEMVALQLLVATVEMTAIAAAFHLPSRLPEHRLDNLQAKRVVVAGHARQQQTGLEIARMQRVALFLHEVPFDIGLGNAVERQRDTSRCEGDLDEGRLLTRPSAAHADAQGHQDLAVDLQKRAVAVHDVLDDRVETKLLLRKDRRDQRGDNRGPGGIHTA